MLDKVDALSILDDIKGEEVKLHNCIKTLYPMVTEEGAGFYLDG
jgi:hypothetical protein